MGRIEKRRRNRTVIRIEDMRENDQRKCEGDAVMRAPFVLISVYQHAILLQNNSSTFQVTYVCLYCTQRVRSDLLISLS